MSEREGGSGCRDESMFPMPEMDPELKEGLKRPLDTDAAARQLIGAILAAGAIWLSGCVIYAAGGSVLWAWAGTITLAGFGVVGTILGSMLTRELGRLLRAREAEVELPPCTCGIGEGETTSATVSCPRHGHCRGCRQPVGEKHAVACPVYERSTNTNQPPAVDYGDVFEKPRDAAEAARIARREEGRPE